MPELPNGALQESITVPDSQLYPVPSSMPAATAASLQLQRLRWSVGHAYENLPYYRQMFDIAGVHPDDCKDLSDLAEFPFTAKTDLRENYP